MASNTHSPTATQGTAGAVAGVAGVAAGQPGATIRGQDAVPQVRAENLQSTHY